MGEHAHLLTKQITLDTHVEDVVSYIQLWELSNVVLVGHSYVGRITTGAADRLEGSGAIGRMVYLDAAVPEGRRPVVFLQQNRGRSGPGAGRRQPSPHLH
jgi:pimeloyl-ACP methyl ester carboxylesterase